MLQKELGACIEYLLVYITDKVDVVEMKDVFVSSSASKSCIRIASEGS